LPSSADARLFICLHAFDSHHPHPPRKLRFSSQVGAERTAIRLSPWSNFLDADDSEVVPLMLHLVSELNKFGLAYVHMVEPRGAGGGKGAALGSELTLEPFKKVAKMPFLAAGAIRFACR
jgi:2,4-dienoyl-CoA reductase-like NADH-dependent reductase (Old Yellow Enzyme family)